MVGSNDATQSPSKLGLCDKWCMSYLILLYIMITFSPSFYHVCPAVSKKRGFLGRSGSNTENFYQT